MSGTISCLKCYQLHAAGAKPYFLLSLCMAVTVECDLFERTFGLSFKWIKQ